MRVKGCLLHNSDDWKTPSNLYKAIKDNNYIDCFQFKANKDQYEEIHLLEKLYINPPYSHLRTKKFLNWIEFEISYNDDVILLIPSRTDTKIFYELCKFNPKIYFIKGRLHFNDSKESAPFPSIIMRFRKYPRKEYENLTLEEFIETLRKGGE